MKDTLSNAELSRLSMSVTRPIPISSLDTNQDRVVDRQEVATFMASRGEQVDQVSWLQLLLIPSSPQETVGRNMKFLDKNNDGVWQIEEYRRKFLNFSNN